jgi:hypothetical protein
MGSQLKQGTRKNDEPGQTDNLAKSRVRPNGEPAQTGNQDKRGPRTNGVNFLQNFCRVDIINALMSL